MNDRRGVGGAGMTGRRRGALALLLFLGLSLATGGWTAAHADRVLQDPLAYHATVLNGRTVGSAFMIAPGIVVTNRHVARGVAPGGTATLIASADGRSVAARLIAVSPHMDLAVFAAPPDFLPPVAPAAAAPRRGLEVISAGVDAGGRAWPAPKMALAGEVIEARAHVPAYGPGLIAWLPGVRPGFSGGPMFDRAGRLIGMVTAIRPAAEARRVEASGFAPGAARPAPAREAFVLRAGEVRAEALRLARR